MPDAPRPGLELLIRRSSPGQPAFELKVLPADRAFLRLRPRARRDAVAEVNEVEEGGRRIWMLRLRDGGEILRMSEHELEVWRRMDGRHTIQELALILVVQFGRFDFDEIRRLLARLRALGLVEEVQAGLFRRREGERQGRVRGWAEAIATFDHRFEEVDALFARLHRPLRRILGPRALPALAALGLTSLAAHLALRLGGVLDLSALPLGVRVAGVLLLLPACMVLHELAHGLACKAHGRRVKALGLTLQDYLLPSMYVDVTDIFMASRRARVVVDLAGPLANLLLAAPCWGLAVALPPGPARGVLVLLADLHVGLAIFTAWPFHPLVEDGAQALGELLKTPLLRRRAWDLLRGRVLEAGERRAAVIYLAGLLLTALILAAALMAARTG